MIEFQTQIPLSILIPSVFDRSDELNRLKTRINVSLKRYETLCMDSYSVPLQVEILILTDNRMRILGSKRNVMMDYSVGRYIMHLDDDDMIDETFFETVLPVLDVNDVDVVSYDSRVFYNDDHPFVTRTGLQNENEQISRNNHGFWVDIKRKPWHWCCWNRKIVEGCKFGNNASNEDWSWLSQVIPKAKTEEHIDAVLHEYWYSDTTTIAQKPIDGQV